MKNMRLELELDRISNLQDDITENILSCLPLKEAVRTSLLSRKWRYKWNLLQALVFHDKCLSTQTHPTCSFVNIVDQVLLLHTGPVHKFKLSLDDELATRDIDRWIFHLSKTPVIKEMIVNIWRGNRYNIPSCLFSFQDIVHLDLLGCLLNPRSSTLKGFRRLKTLHLEKVTTTQDVFENLIGCSPLLEKLHLIDCHGFTNLKIDSPKLSIIYIDGVFHQFNLVNSSNLVWAYFVLQVNSDQIPASSGNLISFFHQHPHIQNFSSNGYFLEYLSNGVLPEKLPEPCLYLNYLSLCICFADPGAISTLLCLLRSSPAIQKLLIWVDPEEDESDVREVKSYLYDNYNCTHTQLRIVEITKISNAKAELDFIKILLLNSPVLERMTVQPTSADGFSNLVRELLLFRRDSKRAEIMILDPLDPLDP